MRGYRPPARPRRRASSSSLTRLRAAAAERGWDLDDQHVYRDDGYSGARIGRPGLDRLRRADAVRAEPGEAALAARLSGWYLEPQATVYQLARRLTDLGVPAPRG